MMKVTSAVAKMGVKDDWVAAAMTDDDMVVELLIRLKHTGTVVADQPAVNLPPLRWGIRRLRSRSSRFGGVMVSLMKKDVDSVRASPKTPLSWSGGSGSGGASASPSADGFEDTSRQTSCSTSTGSGSKAFPINKSTSSDSKRLKKRKSSSDELKDEEKLKLKERLDLQKDIATLRATFDEQNERNLRLKRVKLDLNSGLVTNEKPSDLLIRRKSQLERLLPEGKSCKVERKTENQGSFFFVPDLNMLPFEDEIMYGTS